MQEIGNPCWSIQDVMKFLRFAAFYSHSNLDTQGRKMVRFRRCHASRNSPNLVNCTINLLGWFGSRKRPTPRTTCLVIRGFLWEKPPSFRGGSQPLNQPDSSSFKIGWWVCGLLSHLILKHAIVWRFFPSQDATKTDKLELHFAPLRGTTKSISKQ